MKSKTVIEENKRVRNATPTTYDGIVFKSKLEMSFYKTLKEQGLNPLYENTKYVLFEGFRPTVPFYDKDIKTHDLKLNEKKLIDSTYTPDFTVEYKGYTILIEAKGFQQETFVIKKKLFRRYLEMHPEHKWMYFEIYTKRQLLQAIDIIKKL